MPDVADTEARHTQRAPDADRDYRADTQKPASGDRNDRSDPPADAPSDKSSKPAGNKGDGGAAGKPGEQGEHEKKDAPPEKPSPLRKTWVRVLIGVIAGVLLIAGIIFFHHWWTHGRFVQSTNDAYLAADEVTISTKVAGTVEQVLVEDNQEVAAGQPLVRLDARSNVARVAQAQAQAAQGRAEAIGYEAQIREQQAAIEQAAAQLTQAEVQRRYASGEVERYAPLASSGAETTEKLANLISSRDQAAAQVRRAEASLREARDKVGALRAQIGVANAQIEAAEAQRREAEIDVESALIRSSIAGRVGDRTVRLGQQTQVGTNLMTIVPDQRLYLVANFKETQVGLMRIGQPASIKVDALSGETLDGEVESFAPGTGAEFALIPPSNATGNFTKIVQRIPVRIRIHAGPEARRVLVAGMSVEVSVDTVGSRYALKDNERESKAEAKGRERQHDDEVREDRKEEPQRATNGPGSPAPRGWVAPAGTQPAIGKDTGAGANVGSGAGPAAGGTSR
jgi:membrane fusion protein (multidrug efflux system)